MRGERTPAHMLSSGVRADRRLFALSCSTIRAVTRYPDSQSYSVVMVVVIFLTYRDYFAFLVRESKRLCKR